MKTEDKPTRAEEILSKWNHFDTMFADGDYLFPEQKIRVLNAMNEYTSEQCQKRDAEIRKLKFMIDNGLGWDDMINDITMPHEI